jgi:hypothetical protein
MTWRKRQNDLEVREKMRECDLFSNMKTSKSFESIRGLSSFSGSKNPSKRMSSSLYLDPSGNHFETGMHKNANAAVRGSNLQNRITGKSFLVNLSTE